MRKTLLSLMGAAVLAACTTASDSRVADNYTVNNTLNIDHKKGTVTHKTSHYNLTPITLGGRNFTLHPHPYRKDEELGFIARAYDDITEVINDRERTVTIESDKVYVAKRVMVKETDSERPAQRITLKTEGKFGVRATRDKEGRWQYELATIETFEGGNFYTPIIEEINAEGKVTATRILLIPVAGTDRAISPDGKISLRNNGNIYELTPVNSTDLEKRAMPPVKTEPSTGSVEDIK